MVKIITIYVKNYNVDTLASYKDFIIKIHREFNKELPGHNVKIVVDDIIRVLNHEKGVKWYAKKYKGVGAQKTLSFPK